MSLNQHRIQVLTILSKNLDNPQPQLVPTTAIAGQMDIRFSELQQVLLAMDGMGVIQTDPDLQYSLITRKGLNYLKQQRLNR